MIHLFVNNEEIDFDFVKSFCQKNLLTKEISVIKLEFDNKINAIHKNQVFNNIVKNSAVGDTILFYSVADVLWNNYFLIVNMLNTLFAKSLNLGFIDENIVLKYDEPANKSVSKMLKMSKAISSKIVKQKLVEKKAEGVVVGRPIGSTSIKKIEKLGKDKYIQNLLMARCSISQIAKDIGVHRFTLTKYINSKINLKKYL
jgi:putative DNA-invertase from lambdoid prophage Rac